MKQQLRGCQIFTGLNKLLRIFAFLVLLGCYQTFFQEECYAQGRSTIDVSGKIIDADSLDPIPAVHVFIKDQTQGTISNRNGFFSISIGVGDTLVFSSVGYHTLFYRLPDSLNIRNPFIEISLKSDTIKLKEVLVRGHLNPAAVRRYLENIKAQKRHNNPADLTRDIPKSTPKTKPEGRAHTVGLGSSTEGGAALEGVLTGLANLFNKRAQQQKRIARLLEERRNLEAQKAYREFLDTKFNEQIVAEATGLQGSRLDKFLAYCNFSDEFIYAATEYEILAAIFSRLERFDR